MYNMHMKPSIRSCVCVCLYIRIQFNHLNFVNLAKNRLTVSVYVVMTIVRLENVWWWLVVVAVFDMDEATKSIKRMCVCVCVVKQKSLCVQCTCLRAHTPQIGHCEYTILHSKGQINWCSSQRHTSFEIDSFKHKAYVPKSIRQKKTKQRNRTETTLDRLLPTEDRCILNPLEILV